jgi:hypothetical protein
LGISGTEGLKAAYALSERAGSSDRLIHQEQHDDDKKLPKRRLPRRRRRPSRGDLNKLIENAEGRYSGALRGSR